MTRFRIVTPPVATLGESPLWDVDEQRFYWVDSMAGSVFRCDPYGGELDMWDLPTSVGAIALRARGGAVVTLATGIHLLDLDTGEVSLVAEPGPGRPARFNDGKVDRQGRLVTGTMELGLIHPSTNWLVGKVEADGRLYRLDPDLTLHEIKNDVGITNGPCFSPDGRTFYFSDSWRDEILAFDYDTDAGTLSGERRFVSYEKDKGETGLAQPDGSTVDEDGFVWSVAVYGGEIRRYAPDGSLERRIALPVRKATSVMFGGADLDVLYVTTMANPDLPMPLPPDGPVAGSVLAIHGLGVRGVPERRFAG